MRSLNSARTLLLLCSAVAAFGQTSRPLPSPPTPAEQAKWRAEGRTLPAPERLQPTLDPALPAYAPLDPAALKGHFKGAASDVLAVLTKNWIAAFRQY
jgi:phosphate transport system substrate-binding protein